MNGIDVEYGNVHNPYNRLSSSIGILIHVPIEDFDTVENFKLYFDDNWPKLRDALVEKYDAAKRSKR